MVPARGRGTEGVQGELLATISGQPVLLYELGFELQL